MESLSSEQQNLVCSILSQIDTGISEIKEWNKDITCADVVERFSYDRIGREYVELYEAVRR